METSEPSSKKISTQQQVWNAIAEEWHKFKVKEEKTNKNTIKFLKSQTGKILDLGSGSGRYLTKIKNGEMYLIDFSGEMINLAKKLSKNKKIPAKFFVSDMTKLPFEDNFFNSAIASSSFHCLNKAQQKKAAKELYRVLKPKAKAEISVWNIESKRFKNAQKEKYIKWRNKGKRYYYLFEPEEAYELFEKAGFKIKKSLHSSRFLDAQKCTKNKNISDIVKKEEPGIMISFIVEKYKIKN